jgi:CDP-glucose 4,6-dehydratase
MEGLVKEPTQGGSGATRFWAGKRVLVTGHTGFKGGWLAFWLQSLGAKVAGYSRPPSASASFFEACQLESKLSWHTLGDVCDGHSLSSFLKQVQPHIVFHLAAQALVRMSYQDPLDTYQTNVLGTVHLLEAVKHTQSVEAVVVVTSDKCYENKEWLWGYRENDPLGGHDPYSSSKGCQELVTACYRNSFFNNRGPSIATARAGNVIGGGDWSADRLIPDAMRAYFSKSRLTIRYPKATRPWQHVLEPLNGYLMLAEQLCSKPALAGSYNFGPLDCDVRTVEEILDLISKALPSPLEWGLEQNVQLHEAGLLKLDCSKSMTQLGWQPRWALEKAVSVSCDWYSRASANADMAETCERDLEQFVTGNVTRENS